MSRSRVATVTLVLASVLASMGIAAADPVRAEVLRLLGGYERAPDVDALRRLGPGTDRALIAIAEDASVARARRGAALLALGAVPSSAGLDYLRLRLGELRAATANAELLDLESCLHALGRFGLEAVPDVMPMLVHPHPIARAAAVRALAASGWPEARGALAQRLAVETSPSVRDTIVRALRALPAPAAPAGR